MQINFDKYSRFIKLLMEIKCIVDYPDIRQFTVYTCLMVCIYMYKIIH